MKIELASGETVWLDAFHTTKTYGGLLEGRPTREINARILESALYTASRLWNALTPHLIPPLEEERADGLRLPEMINFALLGSCTPVKASEYGGSTLVVIWFAPEQSDVPLSIIVSEAVRDIPWADLAEPEEW